MNIRSSGYLRRTNNEGEPSAAPPATKRARLGQRKEERNAQRHGYRANKPKPKPVPDEGRWNKIVDSVKGVFASEPAPQIEPPKPSCRMVPVEREFRRPIAYDVDYVYKGTKYRSRLVDDPGNRLRIRVSVMPYVPGQGPATP